MRGGINVKKLTVQYSFLQILFRESEPAGPFQNTRVFTFLNKTYEFCEAKYIQICREVYRNSESRLFFR